jgi:hypothetical protein
VDEPALRERVRRICLAFPEAEEESRNPLHSGFFVRKKAFAYYLNSHHGDGRLAFDCRVGAEMQEMLLAADPVKFYRPKYVGHHGWLGVYIDLGPVDWVEIEMLALQSYRFVAPKTLARLVANR